MGVQLSPFVHKFEDGEDIILFNTENKAVVGISKNSFNELFAADSEDAEGLTKLGFIVDSVEAKKIEFMETVNDPNSFFTKIYFLPTTKCNFSCSYCFEKNMKKDTMSLNLIDNSIDLISDYIIKNRITDVEIELFGGEPTLYWNNIFRFLDKLEACFKHNLVNYYVSMTTNGYLLNDSEINEMMKFNWKKVQITVDGPSTIHDGRRTLKNGAPSFDIIISNIKKILERDNHPEVILRVNVDINNYKSIPELLEYLSIGFNPQDMHLSLSPVTGNGNLTIPEDLWANIFIELYKKAVQLGFKLPSYYTYCGLCAAKVQNSFVLNPDGHIYKCTELMDSKVFSLGRIENGINNKNLNLLAYRNQYEDCFKKGCSFIPLCHMGCRSESYKAGDISKPDCHYDLIMYINESLILYKRNSGRTHE